MSVTQEMVSRCLALIPLIREREGITLEELGRLAQLPPEQIAGELGQVLMMCGVPPYFPHDFVTFTLDGDRVKIHFADHFRRPVSLTALEALALKLACESVVGSHELAVKEVTPLMAKVEAAMAPEQRRQFQNLTRRVAIPEDREPPGSVRGRVALAIAERRVLGLDYRAAGRSDSRLRTVEPYGILAREGFWYLVGRDRPRDRIIPFRLDRVRSIEEHGESFEIPSAFRLSDYATGPLIPDDDGRPRALVRVEGPGARWLRETVPQETLEEVGAQGVHWRPSIGSEEGLTRFLLEFGTDAEVLEPASLRARIRQALEATLAANS